MKTWTVPIEIPLVSPKVSKHRGSFLRNMAIYEGNELLTEAFHAIMDKIEADIL